MREQSTNKQSLRGGAMDEPGPDLGPGTENQAERPGKLPVPQMLLEGPTDDPSMAAVVPYPSAAWSKATHNARRAGVGGKPARPRSAPGSRAPLGKGRPPAK